ncbi:MAG: 50S ribosomal protein L22 [bacterium]|nr:50S ribosomal protein L22 [bacterium]
MEIKAEQKYLLMSPRKVRLVVNLIKKLKPLVAIETLQLIGKRAAEPVAKVIKQAVANAKEKGVDGADLIFKEIQVGEGPSLKRGRPVSKGRWHPIKKRMSHIRVILWDKK